MTKTNIYKRPFDKLRDLCFFRSEGCLSLSKAPHSESNHMKRHILPILLPLLFALFFARTASAGVYDIFYPNPYTVEPDTNKMIYPIPVNTGNPLLDLNNKSPFYLNDPNNFETEIIYDPLTGQYTFKRRIGQFYYDTPTTLTQSEYFEYKNRQGIQEYWKERRSQNARSTTNGSSIIPPHVHRRQGL